MDRSELIRATAISAHEKLCAGYFAKSKPYIKETKDEEWIKSHDTNKVDLCKTNLDELPEDWLRERIVGSEIAIDAVLEASESSRPLNDRLIEEVAELLHRRWLERNEVRATEIQKFDYDALPESEKVKDRHFIVSAIEVFSSI